MNALFRTLAIHSRTRQIFRCHSNTVSSTTRTRSGLRCSRPVRRGGSSSSSRSSSRRSSRRSSRSRSRSVVGFASLGISAVPATTCTRTRSMRSAESNSRQSGILTASREPTLLATTALHEGMSRQATRSSHISNCMTN
jgi:hypothetical protein